MKALNLKFEKVHQTKDTLLIGTFKLMYCNDHLFTEYDSIMFNFEEQPIEVDEIKLDFLNVEEFKNKFYKLYVEFEDMVRESNVFKAEVKYSNYKLFIRENDLFVENATPFFRIYKYEIIDSFASLIIFIIKMISALILVLIMKYPFKLFNYLLLCNLFLIPMLYLVFPAILPEHLKYYLFPEFSILIIESIAAFYLIKKAVKFRKVFFLNTFTNVIGYIVYNILIITPFVM